MDERPASADIDLTDSEQRLLDHIRAGLVDAEIAVRLGISNAEVKSRTERLAAKLRVDGREGLKHGVESAEAVDFAAPSSPESTPRRLQLFAGLGGLGVLVVIGSLVAVWAGQADEDPSAAAARDPSSGSVAATATPRPLPGPTAVDGRMMYDLGPLFVHENGVEPVAEVDTREASVAITLRPGARLALVSPAVAWVVFGSGPGVLQASAGLDPATRWELIIYAGENTVLTSRLPGGAAQPATVDIYSSAADGHARLMVVVERSGNDQRGVSDRYHATVARDGRLFIAESVLDESAVIDRWTGALIDVPTDSVRLQNVPINHALNFCDEAACTASVELGSFRFPVAVTYRCDTLGSIEVESVGVVLQLKRAPDQAETGCHFASGALVPAGELLGVPGLYQLSARTPDDNRLSVSVTEGGTLVIGHFQRNAACPCVPGGR